MSVAPTSPALSPPPLAPPPGARPVGVCRAGCSPPCWSLSTASGRRPVLRDFRRSVRLSRRRPPSSRRRRPDRRAAPELDGGVAWLNTAGPIQLKDLRGKIVVLDFWTLCCINCMHTLPDLAKLEKKYANQIVVIGVHSAKFDNEKDSDNIRKAVLRYEISHPVVNDANRTIWNAYDCHSWPSLVLIDPEGNLVAEGEGEGLCPALDGRIARLVTEYRDKKLLDEKPPRQIRAPARYAETGASPLFFPGKVLADGAGKRLFISDSTHHRIVITDLDGKKIAVAGDGQAGTDDGPFDKAHFNDPQGLALDGDTLYVADRKNNLIRGSSTSKAHRPSRRSPARASWATTARLRGRRRRRT